MDQFSTEKLWHSSNVMGFDVDAELHYRTPLKPVKPLFICLLPMQRMLAGNTCLTSATLFCFFSPLLLVHRGARLVARAPTPPHPLLLLLICVLFQLQWEISTSSRLVSYDWFFLPARISLLTPFVTLTCSFVAFMKRKSHTLMTFLLVYKVWFHLCGTLLSFLQIQTAPWWGIYSLQCLWCIVFMYGNVCSHFFLLCCSEDGTLL